MKYETIVMVPSVKTIRPSDVYKDEGLYPGTRDSALLAMRGYRVTAFRPIVGAEIYLSKAGTVRTGDPKTPDPGWGDYDGGPRFILEPINAGPDPSCWE